jgi:hypothetical protein
MQSKIINFMRLVHECGLMLHRTQFNFDIEHLFVSSEKLLFLHLAREDFPCANWLGKIIMNLPWSFFIINLF